MQHDRYIEINPHKRFGSPIIIGTRISAYDALSWLWNGMAKEYLFSEYPELTIKQINACLAYAANRKHRNLFTS